MYSVAPRLMLPLFCVAGVIVHRLPNGCRWLNEPMTLQAKSLALMAATMLDSQEQPHDALVLAVAIGVWLSERQRKFWASIPMLLLDSKPAPLPRWRDWSIARQGLLNSRPRVTEANGLRDLGSQTTTSGVVSARGIDKSRQLKKQVLRLRGIERDYP
jgi:hypothetical protein